MPVMILGLAGLQAHAGQHLGYSQWLEIDQARIDRFAEATGDRSSTAPAFLLVALIPVLQRQIYRLRDVKMGVNYGVEKVRYSTTVPVGSKVRLGATLASVEPLAGGAAQVRLAFVVEVATGGEPACAAEVLFRYFF